MSAQQPVNRFTLDIYTHIYMCVYVQEYTGEQSGQSLHLLRSTDSYNIWLLHSLMVCDIVVIGFVTGVNDNNVRLNR